MLGEDGKLKVGDRVRVRPGTGTAEMIAGFATSGVVVSSWQEDGAERLAVKLDDGAEVTSLSTRDWDLVAP